MNSTGGNHCNVWGVNELLLMCVPCMPRGLSALLFIPICCSGWAFSFGIVFT
jgi:hypothetical protein